MESTTVLIAGAGPSGLVLGALLARMNIKVVILEKEQEVCEDPRGIVVNGDAVRISYQVGIGEGLTKKIGHRIFSTTDIGALNFHRGSFRQRPFMIFDLMTDWAEHAVSQNITQFQPNYEREIRELLPRFPNCELRTGCEVISRQEEDGIMTVGYVTSTGERKTIQTRWLVGADGKRGVVRKKFLEPEGIKQVDGVWPYVGTWVAINLQVDLPTPEKHPEFPLWKLGYTPERVHEEFWPKGFHFCNDSQRPAVSGRFGPKGARFWRHEYYITPEEESDDALERFWKQFSPWMVIPGEKFSPQLKGTTVEYPRDCIHVLRCRPFKFSTKVVNRWYNRNTMLIGDAAHVFPPFGGQGIATGIRDAQALSWRLAMMSHLNVSPQVQTKLLTGWSQERRFAWEAATLSTKLNGSIVNLTSFWWGLVYRTCMRILWWLPGVAKWRTRRAFRDKLIYNENKCPDGFFLQSAGGGRKVAQIWCRSADDERPVLSDEAILRDISHLSLLVLVKRPADLDPVAVRAVLKEADLPEALISAHDVSYLDISAERGCTRDSKASFVFYPCSPEELDSHGVTCLQGYNRNAIQERLHSSVRYVLLRPDFFIHSVARDVGELRQNLKSVQDYLSGAEPGIVH
ncbi:FAD/NAD(P)-binding domain-containing protein [Aspergillus taichungensis]|uniref:FAD/NAD(P)-binding domain-containing protein n=1 Tax=Aspergillus taichungensis TaxID=482145 RepID=A0A2J5HXJ7_9EURO|nr:FAD/NAD(P)-binding domain-containing protein [Aspergillus taichungensis]